MKSEIPTPRTDAEYEASDIGIADLNWSNFARSLERELEQFRKERDEAIRQWGVEPDEWTVLVSERDEARREAQQEKTLSSRYLSALEEIKKLRWGNDGDCGAIAIIERTI